MMTLNKTVRIAILGSLLVMLAMLTGCESMVVMDPKGPIGQAQKDIIVLATILCSVIVVPVLFLTAYIVWRYRDKSGNRATYDPNWDHSTLLETIWWGVPIVVIGIIAGFTAKYTYDLEPSKPIASDKQTIVIQATSLDWKWLFTYPEQGIATVNYLEIPTGRPVRFELTSDAPMNSFWIPQLGGQLYTMSGMSMTLHLQADEVGKYFGSGANFSGTHFTDMRFDVNAVSDDDFAQWVKEVKQSPNVLTLEGYAELAKPSVPDPMQPIRFSSFPEGLYEKIVYKYAPGGSSHHHGGSHGHGGHGSHGKVEQDDSKTVDEQHSHVASHK